MQGRLAESESRGQKSTGAERPKAGEGRSSKRRGPEAAGSTWEVEVTASQRGRSTRSWGTEEEASLTLYGHAKEGSLHRKHNGR